MMTTPIEHLHNNKRKFLSDDEVYPPSGRILSIDNQTGTSCNPKRVKPLEIRRVSPSITKTDDTDDMMICENAVLKENDTDKTNKSQAVVIPKHCNGICDADASPTTFFIRCYCDPYRLNALIPYNSDIY